MMHRTSQYLYCESFYCHGIKSVYCNFICPSKL